MPPLVKKQVRAKKHMEDEKKVEDTTEEDKVVNEDEESEDDEKSEEETSKKEDFEKEAESVPVGKYNQSLRKQRELELEKRELEKQLAENKVEAPAKKEESNEDEEDDFFDEEEDKKEEPKEDMLDEKLKPLQEYIANQEKQKKELDRKAFFQKHPQYLEKDKFDELVDEMDNSINPNSKDSYFVQLEKAHRIVTGESSDTRIESKEEDMASDSASGGSEAKKGDAKEEFTAEDRKQMEHFGVSEEGMRAFKEKVKSGSMEILS